jgi:AbiU2
VLHGRLDVENTLDLAIAMPQYSCVDEFLALRNECIWLQSCLNTFATLFEAGEDTLEVLERAAPSFFGDVNLILHEHFILQVCRITDPATTKGRPNLTIKNLNEALINQNLMTRQIQDASDKIHRYRPFIIEARNQIISHADKARILARTASQPHDRAELESFMAGVYIYVNLVGEALGVGPLDFRYTGSDGDAEDLLSCLRRGLADQL